MKQRIRLLPNLSFNDQYSRIGAISVEEGFKRVEIFDSQKIFGVKVAFNRTRLGTYLHKGIKCVSCERQGHYFAIEKCKDATSKEKYHVNLWGIDRNGCHFMMTSDHIVPKSRGGSDDAANRQPMCTTCNNAKKDLLPGEENYINPKVIFHNCYQGMLKAIREKLEKEAQVATII